MTTTRRILLLLVSVFASLALSAQNYNVTVKLEDSASGEPVGFATVSLTPERGSAKYALSNHEGKAVVEKVRPGKYTLKVEIMGYQPHIAEVEVKETLDLGTIKMELDRELLDAATVSATGNPIIIKKDTVTYNASSFKISDNDMLENLLKKLPGVEVGDDGSITVNGETITKITIDGKTFFLDDPQLASKNIPAKLVEKVNVVKKKSEQAEFTGIDDGEDETIIDLTVQKGMMNGVFGNAMAGGGHDVPADKDAMNDYRYQGALMVGRFTDNSQLSLIANANNTNNRGFNDMAGAMMGNMMGGGRGQGGMMGGGGFGGGSGVTTSWMGGVNGAWDLLDKKMELSGNYMYSGSNTESLQDTYKETIMPDGTVQIQSNSGSSVRRSDGHRVGIRLEHKFSENTSILFQPQFNFGSGDYTQINTFNTWTDVMTDAGRLNKGFSSNTGVNNSLQTNGFLLFRQRLGIPGRTISANVTWRISNNHTDGYNQSVTETFAGLPPAVINQRVDQQSRTRGAGGRVVYTEPLGGGFYLEGSYQFNYSLTKSNKDVYNNDGVNEYTYNPVFMRYIKDGELDMDYSNRISNEYITQSAGLAGMYQEGSVRAQLGISVNPQKTHNETNGESYDNSVVNWAPRAMLFYDFNDNANVRLFYNGRSGQPSTSQLMPVLDNSNPLSMALGNPYLAPYFNHNFRNEWEYSNKRTFFTARLNLQGGINQNPIVNANWYDETGRQYSFPVNGNTAYNANARIMINAPIAKSSFSISNMSNIGYSKSGSYVGKTNLDMARFWLNEDKTAFDYAAFHEAYPDLEETDAFISNTTRSLSVTDRIRATYRSDNLELTLSGRTRFSKPWYSMNTAGINDRATWNNQVSGSVNWTIGQSGFEFATDANYNWYNGYTTPQEPRLVWNANISKLILKKSATIALQAYDILNQARALNVSDTENYHQEVRSNTLGRYIILSFTWRFGSFGQARDRIQQRMQGGRPPMGGGGGYRGGGFRGGPF